MGQCTETLIVADIAIDYRVPLRDMLAGSGCGHVDSRITDRRFPYNEAAKIVECEVVMFHFDRFVPTRKALNLIHLHDAANVWKPAGIEHLVCFGKGRLSEHGGYPISALGSRCSARGRIGIPCLETINLMPMLIIDTPRWDRGWEPRYRFLAFRQRKKRLRSWFFGF